MSASNESNGRLSGPQDAAGMLANLPRTRPQRATPRRTAAREALTATEPKPTRKAPAARKAPTKQRARSTPRQAPTKAPDTEPVPLQGFESESDRAHGPVHPPGGAELVASALDIVGELTKAGFATGERLLKDVLALLPLS